jgi:hypothetical protein
MNYDKSLFAAYLNMARNNCYMALSHIAEKMHKSSVMNEDAMQECIIIKNLTNNKKPDESLRITEMIEHHFPFIKLLVKSRNNPLPADYANALTGFIRQLNELRNYHTHYLHKPYSSDDRMISQLQFLFDASRREVRKRFSLEEGDVKHLVRKNIKIVNGEKVSIEKENFPYAIANKRGEFTINGMAFFLSLLLEKKYAYLFLKQLKGFKSSIDKQKKATLETFCFYHIRIPQPKLQSNDTKIGLLLDVLEELKRCPTGLYDHLAENDRQRFKFMEDTIAADEQPETVLKRSGDRFPHLALRYLELTKSLTSLHFYIDLGKYYFKVYEKNVDSEIRLRRLHKNMRGFGRLDNFEIQKMPEQWKQLVKRTDELPEDYAGPYIAYTMPHFHIVNNQLGIWLGTDPEFPLLSPQIKNAEPQMWLSLYELPALIFYHLLTKEVKECKNVLQLLSQHRKAIHTLFKDIETSKLLPGFNKVTLDKELINRNLQRDYVPKPILEYLLNQKPSKSAITKAEDKLTKLIGETNYLLDKLDTDLEKSKEKVGSRRYKPIQTGRIGDFLARDMLFFQPAIDQIRGKATSTLFQVLQARLAFYGRDKNLLEEIYKECNLIQSKNSHPFLEGLSITSNLADYYRNYLIRRREYLEKCLKKCMQGKIGSKDFHFLHLGEREKRDGNAYYMRLAGKFIKTPLNLPRGLFMKELIRYFADADGNAMQNVVKDNSRINTIFLLKEYIGNVLADNMQEFYSWKRTYTVFNRYYDSRKPNSKDTLEEKYFDTLRLSEESEKIKKEIEKLVRSDSEKAELVKTNYKYYSDNEKQLRHTKACDTILFLIVRDLFPSLESSVFKGLAINQLKLSDILPDAEKGILSQPIEIRLPLHDKFIVQKGLKLKNYGDFRRFLKDRRLESLMTYFDEEIVDRAVLEKELENYDAARIEMHKLVLDFEKEVIIKYSLDYETPEEPCVNHEAVLNCFFQNNSVDPEKRELMENLRNRFSHNQYPDSEKFKEIIKLNNSRSIAKKLVEVARDYFKIDDTVNANDMPL